MNYNSLKNRPRCYAQSHPLCRTHVLHIQLLRIHVQILSQAGPEGRGKSGADCAHPLRLLWLRGKVIYVLAYCNITCILYDHMISGMMSLMAPYTHNVGVLSNNRFICTCRSETRPLYTYTHRYVVEVLLERKGLEARMQSQFVAQQLFSMFSVLDLSDEVGRCVYAPCIHVS